MSQPKRGLDTSNDEQQDGEPSISTLDDQEPPAKKIKGDNEVEEIEEIEEIVRPTTRDWTDIPVWKEGDGSPLMELPLEILDMIFCVRPELDVSVA